MNLLEIYEKLIECGLKVKIEHKHFCLGACEYIDYDELTILNNNKEVNIKLNNLVYLKDTIFIDENTEKAHLIPLDYYSDSLCVHTVLHLPTGSDSKWESHCYYVNDYDDLMEKFIKEFLQLSINKNFNQMSLF